MDDAGDEDRVPAGAFARVAEEIVLARTSTTHDERATKSGAKSAAAALKVH